MPGFRDHQMYARCPECDGPDIGSVGFPLHYPTCSTQPGFEEARARAAAYKAQRRRERDELIASPETARLRKLRTVSR